MAVKVIELLAAHGGIIAIFLGAPYITLLVIINVLWKNSVKDKDRIMKMIESKVEQDAKLGAALVTLKEVIKAQRG